VLGTIWTGLLVPGLGIHIQIEKEFAMLKSLTFWTLVAGVLAFVAKFLFPAFPLDSTGILAVILFFLGLFGIVPAVRGVLPFGDLLKSLPFWGLVVGLIAFVLHYFVPTFPMDNTAILAVVLFILACFGIKPELRLRGIK
jgi:hypothetical protein